MPNMAMVPTATTSNAVAQARRNAIPRFIGVLEIMREGSRWHVADGHARGESPRPSASRGLPGTAKRQGVTPPAGTIGRTIADARAPLW